MIYSKTCEYAIRALVYFARYPEQISVTAHEASRFSGAPEAYIAKIFRGLTRHKILQSQRGAAGGFSLKISPSKLTLSEIVRAVDDQDESALNRCVMGLDQCNDLRPCPLHEVWKPAKQSMCRVMETTTLADLAGISGRFSSPGRRKTLSRWMRGVFTPV